MKNDATVKAILEGDPKPLTELSLLQIKAQQNAGTKIANEDPRAEEYLPHTLNAALQFKDVETSQEYATGLSNWQPICGWTRCPPKVLLNCIWPPCVREGKSTPEQREAYGMKHERDFVGALGETADAQINEANAILSKMRGGKAVDLKAISKSNGPIVAAQLLFVARSPEGGRAGMISRRGLGFIPRIVLIRFILDQALQAFCAALVGLTFGLKSPVALPLAELH